ncbi:MAG: phosphatidate cytidylyltransferase, partial [Alphaproteobacteria bacterium]|nr:phosphatidate cytidylyltransferase [Alphaproteobacteria bacterium]
TLRILAGAIMALVAGAAAVLEYFGFPAVRVLGIIIVLMMIVEMILCMKNTKQSGLANWLFLGWLFVMLGAINAVGTRPQIVLQLLLIICAADIGAWLFGRLIGGDKMWERISANKTWAGQIAGIICGTAIYVAYGLLRGVPFGAAVGMIWTGISVALLSQYGDLTASWIKRKMGIKDFGNILPGHGGMLDRFDGWIYALPLVWLTML